MIKSNRIPKGGVKKSKPRYNQPPEKNPFHITSKYKAILGKPLKVIKAKRKTPIKVLIVCPQGISFSYGVSRNLNALARELGISEVIQTGFNEPNLTGFSIKERTEFEYVVSRYQDLLPSVMKAIPGQKKPTVISEQSLTMKGILKPSPYRRLLLEILKTEAKKLMAK